MDCSATDAHGNQATGSFTVRVQDTAKPVVTVPATITAEATGPNGAQVAYSGVSAHDDIDGDLQATCDPVSAGTFALGTTTVTCSATDESGNTGTNSFDIVVQDTTGPVFDAHDDVTAEATSNAGASVTFDLPTAVDVVDGPTAVSCDADSGDAFTLGETTVTCTTTDERGNTAQTSFKVTVKDTTPPAFEAPADTTVEATGPNGAASPSLPSATDVVDGIVAVTCDPTSDSTFPAGHDDGHLHRHRRARQRRVGLVHGDGAGHDRPVLTLPANQASKPPRRRVPRLSSRHRPTTSSTATSVTCTPAYGSTFPLGSTTVDCTATDAQGNEATGSFTVTVKDTASRS